MEETGGEDPIKRHLVYEKLTGERGVWIADADGARPRLLVPGGSAPSISPDGKWVAYFAECKARAGSELPCTYLISPSGGEQRLLSTRRLDEAMTWSPTSERVGSISAFGGAEYQEPGSDDNELVTIDVASGKEVTVARAPEFFGWSFSPDGESIVFAPASIAEDGYYSEKIDLFVTAADGGETREITETGDASDPVWGPKSIAFAKYAASAKQGVSEIWQIQPDGTGRVSITEPLPKRFVEEGHGGLVPIDWSEDGSALLAGLGGNWGYEPVAVDPETGAARELGQFGRPWGTNTVAVSRDGRWALVLDGSFAEVDSEDRAVVIVSCEGGKPIVVARGAWAANWNR